MQISGAFTVELGERIADQLAERVAVRVVALLAEAGSGRAVDPPPPAGYRRGATPPSYGDHGEETKR